MIGNFSARCAFSLAQEGGFCDVPGDPGGATCHGITIDELAAALGRPVTVDDVKGVTEAQAEAIYQPRYWNAVNGNALPAGVDLMVFDFGINAGPETSAKRLQMLIGAVADGDIGPKTLAKLAAHGPNWVILTLTYSHQAYYRQLPGFVEFGNGWLARSGRCQVAALGLAGASPLAASVSNQGNLT